MGRIEDDTKIFTDHNVYILGAGFSVDAGIPVLKDFLHSMRASLNWLRNQGREHEREATSQVLRFRKQAASAALRVDLNIENIEDLFSLAAASGQYPLAQSVSTAIAATLDYSIEHAKPQFFEARVNHAFTGPNDWEEKHKDAEYSICRIPYYDVYAGLLTGKAGTPDRYMKNTIITFNYDCVLDDAVKKWKVPVWYGFEKDSVEYDNSSTCAQGSTDQTLPILKLHGSVNWAETEKRDGKVKIFGSYADVLASESRPALIPPTWRKSFTGALSQVWDTAVSALSEATRVIIIGFSMPPTDMHIKFLLAAGLQENISLRKIYCFDPNTSVEENLFKNFRPDLKAQGIAEFFPYKTDLLVRGVHNNYQPTSHLFNRNLDNLSNLSLG